MKFQKLTIHNIASIEDATIDFEARPLANSEVFLITGKTGAGKSTILDAICLALYSDTPRLDGTRMQGETKDGEKVVKIDDPRQLMRRNTAEASVSLTFTGSNGVHYEAVWSVARARKKTTGNLQAKVWQLKNLDTGFTFTKDKEIVDGIQAATGLDFNQFCRTTMLSQGEFNRFLNSKDEDKAAILEKITGEDIYSKIGARVYAETMQKDQKFKDAQRLVEGVRTLTEEEIQRRVEALSGLDVQKEEMTARRAADSYKRDWLREAARLNKMRADAEDALVRANAAVGSDEFRTGETLVKDWKATADVRRCLVEARKAEAAQKKQQDAIAALSSDFAALLGNKKYAEDEIGTLGAEVVDIEKFLSDQSDKAAVYENYQTIRNSLLTIHDGRVYIEKYNKDIAKETGLLTGQLVPSYEKQKRAAEEAKVTFDKEDNELKGREEEFYKLNLHGIRARREEAKDLTARIKTAQERLGLLDEARIRYKETAKNLNERQLAITEKQEQSKAMEAMVHDAEVRKDAAKECFENQKDTINKFASAMRARLKNGDVCPVCRQRITAALPHEETLTELVGGLQAAFKSAENEYLKLKDTKYRLDAQIQAELSEYDKASRAFDKDKTVELAERKAHEACESCGIEAPDDTVREALDCQIKSTEEELKALDLAISIGEGREKELAAQRKALNAKRSAIDNLSAKLGQAEKAVAECRGRIATSEALVAARQADIRVSEQFLSGNIVTALWDIDWRAKPKEFAESLSRLAKEYKENVRKKQTLESRLETAGTNVRNVGKTIDSIVSRFPLWGSVQVGPVVGAENLPDKATVISEKVTVALTRMKEAEERYGANNSQVEAFIAADTRFTVESLVSLSGYTSVDISRKDDELQKYRDEVVKKNTLLSNVVRQFDDHQQKKPELAEDDTPESLEAKIVL